MAEKPNPLPGIITSAIQLELEDRSRMSSSARQGCAVSISRVRSERFDAPQMQIYTLQSASKSYLFESLIACSHFTHAYLPRSPEVYAA
jgi:hypothetical protein